jgi:hypothetical protein
VISERDQQVIEIYARHLGPALAEALTDAQRARIAHLFGTWQAADEARDADMARQGTASEDRQA